MARKPSKADVLFAVTMSGITTLVVSFALVSINLGFVAAFWGVWMRTWAIAFVLVTLAILFLAPRIRKLFYH